jgi:predicted Zn-dependent peptidase
VLEARLPNGLTVRLVPRPGFQQRRAILLVQAGSIDTRFRPEPGAEIVTVPAGTAHFLEHELFESGDENASEAFAAAGASCNAFTSHTDTCYTFSCTEAFDESLALLGALVEPPQLTEALIAREREVIAEERSMYEDDPDWRAGRALMTGLYVEHPVREEITGTASTIREIDLKHLLALHRAFYRPEAMLLSIAGDLDPGAVYDAALRSFGGLARGSEGGPTRLHPKEPEALAKARQDLRLKVASPRLLVAWKDQAGLAGTELLRKDLEVTFGFELLFSQASPFFKRTYESGLLIGGLGTSYRMHEAFAYATFGAQTTDPDALLEEADKTLRAALKDGIDKGHLERVKKKAMGRYLRSFNSLEFVASSLAHSWRLGIDLEQYLPTVNAITEEAILERLAGVLRSEARAVVTIRPEATPADEGSPASAQRSS